MIKNIIHTINQNDRLFALISLVIIIVFAAFSKIPPISGKLTGLDIENTHYFKSGKKIAHTFGLNEFIEIKVTPKDTSAVCVFNGLREIEKELQFVFHNIEIRSIHHASALFKNYLQNDANINSVLGKATTMPIVDNLVSKDTLSFLMIVKLDPNQNFDITTFDNLIACSYDGIKSLKPMSARHIENAVESSLKRDVVLISILIILAFSFIIFYTYRSFRALIYIGIIVLVSVIPSFFLLTLFKIPLNLITALTIPIILILSLADAIHLLTGFYNYKGADLNLRITSSMETYFIPAFLTSLTTTIAFSSFIFNSAESIRIFGLIVSLSVIPSLIFSYTLSPFLFKNFLKPKPMHDLGIKKILHFLNHYKRIIAFSLIIVALISLPFLFRLQFTTDFESFIPKRSMILKNRNEMIKDFDSQLSIHVLIEKSVNQSQKRKQQIENDIIMISNLFDTISTVGDVKSIRDLKQFMKRYGPFSKFVSVPQKDNPYVSENGNFYRIELRLNTMNKLGVVSESITQILDKYEYPYEIFSQALLLDEINKKVAASFLKSLLFSVILIFVMIIVLTRSFKITLISIIANLIPLSFIILLFYFLKLDLNILTAITIIVCLGFMVDDTIHVIYRKLILQREDHELEYGIITTSNVLILGFAAFAISDFQPSQIFGIVTSLVFLITTIADLVLLPYLLDYFLRKKDLKHKLKAS